MANSERPLVSNMSEVFPPEIISDNKEAKYWASGKRTSQRVNASGGTDYGSAHSKTLLFSLPPMDHHWVCTETLRLVFIHSCAPVETSLDETGYSLIESITVTSQSGKVLSQTDSYYNLFYALYDLTQTADRKADDFPIGGPGLDDNIAREFHLPMKYTFFDMGKQYLNLGLFGGCQIRIVLRDDPSSHHIISGDSHTPNGTESYTISEPRLVFDTVELSASQQIQVLKAYENSMQQFRFDGYEHVVANIPSTTINATIDISSNTHSQNT
jgi:hypothetical protein